METIGELEAEVLCVVESKKQATVLEIVLEMKLKREVNYSTVSTTLSRLFKKNLVKRRALTGPGGLKYLYSQSKDTKMKREIVEASLERLTRAFGSTAYDAFYRKLYSIE